jgi:hypothetical protein
MSIKITGDAEQKKYMYKKKHTLTQITREEQTKHVHIRRQNKKNKKKKAQIIGLDGESKSNENVFCC